MPHSFCSPMNSTFLWAECVPTSSEKGQPQLVSTPLFSSCQSLALGPWPRGPPFCKTSFFALGRKCKLPGWSAPSAVVSVSAHTALLSSRLCFPDWTSHAVSAPLTLEASPYRTTQRGLFPSILQGFSTLQAPS